MGMMAGLVALGATLLAGVVLVAGGGALTAAILQQLLRRMATPLPFKPLWRIAALALLLCLVLGNVLTLLTGGPSPLVTVIGLPIYLAYFSWRLRKRFPEAFAARRWWTAPLQALIATLGGFAGLYLLMLGLRTLTG